MQMRPALDTDVDGKGEILDDNWESQLGGKLELLNNESSFMNEDSYRDHQPKNKAQPKLASVAERIDSDEIDLSYRNGDENQSLKQRAATAQHNRDSMQPLNKQSPQKIEAHGMRSDLFNANRTVG